MFNLSAGDCRGRILGCGDGPASFNAEMAAGGHEVISIDPIYGFTGPQIRQRFEETVDRIIDQVKATPDDWVWGYHRDADDLRENRRRALETFLADYGAGRRAGRYLPASLPRLPFADGAFGLALCSHLLFLYSDLLDSRFHIE